MFMKVLRILEMVDLYYACQACCYVAHHSLAVMSKIFKTFSVGNKSDEHCTLLGRVDDRVRRRISLVSVRILRTSMFRVLFDCFAGNNFIISFFRRARD